MSDKLHFDLDQAAGIAALPPDDPERVRAFSAAQHNPELQQALEDGERLMQLLGQLSVPAPTPQALQRAAQAVLDEMDRGETADARPPETADGRPTETADARPTETADRRSRYLAGLLLPATLVLTWTALLLTARGQVVDWNTEMFSSVVLLALSTLAMSALTRIGGVLLTGAAVVGSLVFAAAGSVDPGVGSLVHGLHCTIITVGAAAIPLAAAVGLALTGRLRDRGMLAFGAVAALGGLAGTAALHLTCGSAMIGHLLLFHAGGVLVAGMIGSSVGLLPALRRSPAS
jgi:hypothetical protein